MLQIILIRPGRTDYDEQGRIQGTLDIPINEAGRRDAAECVAAIKPLAPTVLYSAACLPAVQTAEAVAAGLGIRLKSLDTLTNLDHGLWQGRLIDDVKRTQPKVYRQWQDSPQTVCPPQGEMLAEVQERVQSSLARMIRKHDGGVVGLVAPEPLASVIRSYLKHDELGNLWKTGATGGSWEIISVEPRGVAVAR